MNEIVFLRTNADKWKRFETLLSGKDTADAEMLVGLFIELTDDLSYARTFYPGTETTRYLHNLTARVHQQIYQSKKEESGRIARFWKYELPEIFYQSRRELFYAFLIFGFATFVGWLSSANDDMFVRLIMGDQYVNMTIQNIRNDDPMAVYKKMNQIDMFLGITLNNVMVSFYAFIMGIVLSFGTAFILVQNGIMLGAFHYFLYDYDLLGQAMLTIWIHGTIEISAIILAGAAGLVMGNSILFPGSFTRIESFHKGVLRGMKMAVGLVPMFIVAGFLEGFVTRYTEMPVWLSLTVILGSLAAVIWYVIIYPVTLIRAEETPYADTPEN